MAPTANKRVAAMVQTFKVRSWSKFEKIYEQRFRPKRGVYYYRGQSNDSWDLQTRMSAFSHASVDIFQPNSHIPAIRRGTRPLLVGPELSCWRCAHFRHGPPGSFRTFQRSATPLSGSP